MAWTISEDVEEFAAATGPFLREEPALNTVPLTLVATLQRQGPHAFGEQPPRFGWWQPADGPVGAACMQTPPFPLLLTAGPPEALDELADTLAAAGWSPAEVNAGETAAARFAARWEQRTGAAASVVQRHRLYRLGELVPPSPPPEGQPRAATPADQDLVTGWLLAFVEEVEHHVRRDIAQTAREAADRIASGRLTLWEAGGEPVAMAGITQQIAGTARVAPVYTPPHLRRRGYAGAVTAAITQAALDAGAEEVLLFTDLANPTSNGVYQRLGYEPIDDRILLSFT